MTPAKAQSSRSRLRIVSIVVLVAMVVSAILLARRESEDRRQRYVGVLEQSVGRATVSLRDFLRPIHEGLNVVRDWSGSGVLVLDRSAESLENKIAPLLRDSVWIDGVDLVATNGAEFRMSRVGEDWKSELDPEGSLRGAPWYLDPDKTRSPGWTNVQSSTADVAQGVTAALEWPAPSDSAMPHVAAFHVPRTALRDLITTLAPTERGLVLFIGQDKRMVWISREDGEHLEQTSLDQLIGSTEEPEALLSRMVFDWYGRPDSPRGVAFRLNHAGEDWWYLFEDVEGLENQSIGGCLIPESELAARVTQMVGWSTWLLLGVIGVGVLALIQIAYGYRTRLIGLGSGDGHANDDETRLRAAIDGGESDRLEFKSTLRWNLKANKPGREIEQSWLKTLVAFMNSSGGTLMVGVDDDGSIIGTERDGFRNEDKYLLHFDNLINKQVGLEFARYLTFRLRPIDGKRILVVDARPAREPVFLKVDDEQDFYVRVGASSRRLPLDKTLEYLQQSGRIKPIRRKG